MKFPFYIARRYLFAKKSHNAINVITLIAVIGVMVCTMAFIIILSVFNGFDNLVTGMYNTFYSDLQVTPAKGKVIMADTIPLDKLIKIDGLEDYSLTLEDNVLMVYDERQWAGIIRGVDEKYKYVTGIDTTVYEGHYLDASTLPGAVVGRGVAHYLGIGLDFVSNLQLYVPKRTAGFSMDPNKTITQKSIRPVGKYAVQPEIDSKYILVPLSFARNLFQYENHYSSIEIAIKEKANPKVVKRQLEALLGDGYIVKNKLQQNELLYKTMRSEKWAIFFILTFVLIIASFNLLGSISMLIIEKKDDIQMLQYMGTQNRHIKKIYQFEGMLIAMAGLVIGLILGLGICYAQQKFGIIKLHGVFVIDAYPVQIKSVDIITVIITVSLIGYFASWYPVKRLIVKYLQQP